MIKNHHLQRFSLALVLLCWHRGANVWQYHLLLNHIHAKINLLDKIDRDMRTYSATRWTELPISWLSVIERTPCTGRLLLELSWPSIKGVCTPSPIKPSQSSLFCLFWTFFPHCFSYDVCSTFSERSDLPSSVCLMPLPSQEGISASLGIYILSPASALPFQLPAREICLLCLADLPTF